jgi:hypothetical protein
LHPEIGASRNAPCLLSAHALITCADAEFAAQAAMTHRNDNILGPTDMIMGRPRFLKNEASRKAALRLDVGAAPCQAPHDQWSNDGTTCLTVTVTATNEAGNQHSESKKCTRPLLSGTRAVEHALDVQLTRDVQLN